MKRVLYITLLYIMVSAPTALRAQNTIEQVLIFRNTGEVNLLYSNNLDSIVCSPMDKDSLFHNEYVSQIFYSKDTTLIVPISEIDSVTFGERNIAEYKKDVYQIGTKDLSYIVRYDGAAIYYRTDTPSDILPAKGHKLFYGNMDDVFPIGLCAKATDIKNTGNEIMVSLSDIGLEGIFDKLFFAGRIEPENVTLKRSAGARTTEINIPCKIDLNGRGSVNVAGNVEVSTDFVANPLRNYYHANIIMDSELGFDISLNIKEGGYSYEKEITTFHFPNIAGVIHPELTVSAFADINAEAAFDYSMQRQYHQKWEWTRHNGKDIITNKAGNDSQKPEDKAKMDITCNGSLSFGPKFTFEFSTLLSTVGVRTKITVGPEIKGQLSMGIIEDLSEEYSPELYAKGEINVSTKLGISGHAFTRNLIWGEESEYKFFEASKRWGIYTYRIFPNFVRTKAVEIKHNENNVTISTATVSQDSIIRDVESGFQIEDGSQEVLDHIFTKTIIAEKDSVQVVDTVFVLPKSKYAPDTTVVRPIFKYAGYTILAKETQVQTNDHIQPLVAIIADGATTILFGYPMIGSVVNDSIYYNIGNYMPVVVNDTIFNNITPPDAGIHISSKEESILAGQWNGKIDNETTSITFLEDHTGSIEQKERKSFSYRINYPQSGYITLNMEDSTTKVYILYSLTENELILKERRKEIYHTFTKQ